MASWQEFTGLNRGYVLELYDRYRQDPSSVDAETRALFDQWTPPPAESAPIVGRRRPREDRRRRQPRAGDPAIRAPGGAARSARDPSSDRRSVAVARDPRPHRRGSARAPGVAADVPGQRARREHARGDRIVPRHLLLDDRLRLRARVRARGAPLAAQRRGVRAVPRAVRSDQPGRAARAVDADRGVRAVPAPRVSRQDALLDRGARHAGADPRRGDRGSGRVGNPQHPHRDGAPRAAERDGARAQQALRPDSRGVQGAGIVARRSARTWRGRAT